MWGEGVLRVFRKAARAGRSKIAPTREESGTLFRRCLPDVVNAHSLRTTVCKVSIAMSRANAFDASARKRPVNLSLNEDLVAQARQLTDNLSAEVENLLADFVVRQRAERDEHRESLQRAARQWGAFTRKHGSLSDEFPSF